MAKIIDIVGKVISGEWGNEDSTGNGTPVLRTTNFTNNGILNYDSVVKRDINKNVSEKMLRKGDIIIEKSGGTDKTPVGRVVYFEGEDNKYLFNNFTGLLRVKDPTVWYPKYVFYSLFYNYLAGGTKEFENRTTGIHNLKTDAYVRQTEIKQCDITKQIEYVNKIDKVTELISVANVQLAKLDELVKAKFVEMFGDPVLNEKKWRMVKLSQLAEIKIGPFGTLLHKDDYVNGAHSIINPSHIVDGHIRPDGNFSVTDEKYRELSNYQLRIGDLVLGRRGEMGKCAVVEGENLLCGTGSMIIRPDAKKMKAYFLQKIISNSTYRKKIESISVGVTMQNLNVQNVSDFDIPLLPVELQEAYIEILRTSSKIKSNIKKKLNNLETLKKSLMQEYFG